VEESYILETEAFEKIAILLTSVSNFGIHESLHHRKITKFRENPQNVALLLLDPVLLPFVYAQLRLQYAELGCKEY
jgi:hypothetical protein